MKGLRDGDVSVAHTARELGMSVRTLQRRLQEEELSFDDVYDATRKELARRYLGTWDTRQSDELAFPQIVVNDKTSVVASARSAMTTP